MSDGSVCKKTRRPHLMSNQVTSRPLQYSVPSSSSSHRHQRLFEFNLLKVEKELCRIFTSVGKFIHSRMDFRLKRSRLVVWSFVQGDDRIRRTYHCTVCSYHGMDMKNLLPAKANTPKATVSTQYETRAVISTADNVSSRGNQLPVCRCSSNQAMKKLSAI